MKKNNKGFTLAELLIVVAIIAVLVAVAIPVFSGQLEKSRQATTLANLRSGYAEATVELFDKDLSGTSVTVDKTINITTKSGDFDKLDADEINALPFKCTLPQAVGEIVMTYTFELTDGEVTKVTVAKKAGG